MDLSDQFNVPAPGSQWVHNKTGKPAKVTAVVTHPTLDLQKGTISQGQHQVWVDVPHRQRRFRTQVYALHDFYAAHSKQTDG